LSFENFSLDLLTIAAEPFHEKLRMVSDYRHIYKSDTEILSLLLSSMSKQSARLYGANVQGYALKQKQLLVMADTD
jgi:hypothetical protein